MKQKGLKYLNPLALVYTQLALVVPLPRSSEHYKNLTKSVCYFICKDTQPFDTVKDQGFRKMLHTFEPRYVPPDRTTIASSYIPKMYNSTKEEVRKQLVSNGKLSFHYGSSLVLLLEISWHDSICILLT